MKELSKPAGVDEHIWETAKEAAARQGRAGDYAYIRGIYNRITEHRKSHGEESAREYIRSLIPKHQLIVKMKKKV